MLRKLLLSFGSANLPKDCEVTFLIVENDTKPARKGLVDSFRPLANGARLSYALETEPGIPFGRNRAAKEAVDAGACLLAFVDDDETVAQDWLVRLFEGYRKSKAVLVGAPLRAAAAQDDLDRVQSIMHAAITRRFLQKELRAGRKASLEDSGPVTTVTNNWLADTKLFSKHNIWFDEALRLSGGSDAKFHSDVREAGLPIGWVADAFVYEEIPRDRLSFRYQTRRARDQVNAYLRRKFAKSKSSGTLAVSQFPIKVLFLLGLCLLALVRPRVWLMELARTLGWVLGAFGLLTGYRSKLYEKITGD